MLFLTAWRVLKDVVPYVSLSWLIRLVNEDWLSPLA